MSVENGDRHEFSIKNYFFIEKFELRMDKL